MQTSAEARESLSTYTFGEIQEILNNRNQEHNSTIAWAVYLGFLCAKGQINDIETFLQNMDEDLDFILNARSNIMYGGTVLHMALYWNSGNRGVELFQLLLNNGAIICQDNDGNYPWQQNRTRWVTGLNLDDSESTIRSVDEFTETYQFIGEMYNMH